MILRSSRFVIKTTLFSVHFPSIRLNTQNMSNERRKSNIRKSRTVQPTELTINFLISCARTQFSRIWFSVWPGYSVAERKRNETDRDPIHIKFDSVRNRMANRVYSEVSWDILSCVCPSELQIYSAMPVPGDFGWSARMRWHDEIKRKKKHCVKLVCIGIFSICMLASI